MTDVAGSQRIVALTPEGKAVVEAQRHPHGDGPQQSFYAGVVKPRELAHDAQVYRAFTEEAARIDADGVKVTRVVLDYELKRDYQTFLNRDDGPDDAALESDRRAFAESHDLHVNDDHLELPDLRIEYATADGRVEHRDIDHHRALLTGANQRQDPRWLRVLPRRRRHARRHAVQSASSLEAGMTIDDRVRALGLFGFGERQTRFLVTVALHGGFCLRRQYMTFARLRYGASVRDFLERLVVRKLATRFEFRRDRGHVYHLHASAMYDTIGQPDNRNRRSASAALMARKMRGAPARAIQELAGASGFGDDAAIHAPQSRGAGRRDSASKRTSLSPGVEK